MTEEEFQALQSKQLSTVTSEPTPKIKSVTRGAMSGVLGGLQPQIAGLFEAVTPKALGGTSYDEGVSEAQYLNEKAFRDNPITYGAGYTGGALATLPIGGAVLKGAGSAATKLAPELASMASLRMQGIPTKAEAGMQVIKDAIPGASKVADVVSKASQSKLALPAAQTATRGTTAVSNTPSFSQINEYLSNDEKRKQAMQLNATPEGRAETNTESPFTGMP